MLKCENNEKAYTNTFSSAVNEQFTKITNYLNRINDGRLPLTYAVEIVRLLGKTPIGKDFVDIRDANVNLLNVGFITEKNSTIHTSKS